MYLEGIRRQGHSRVNFNRRGVVLEVVHDINIVGAQGKGTPLCVIERIIAREQTHVLHVPTCCKPEEARVSNQKGVIHT